jgi:threonine synthase
MTNLNFRISKFLSASNIHQIILSTAHPAKFSEAVTDSLSKANVPFDFEKDVLPKEMVGLLEKERRVESVYLKDASRGTSVVEKLAEGTRKVVERFAEPTSSEQVSAPATVNTQSV